jgi:hypothetical protein
MIDFKYLCSTSTAYQSKFGGVEVRHEHVRRNYRAVDHYLDVTENGSNLGKVGPSREILDTYGDRGSGCTGLIIGQHGFFFNDSHRSTVFFNDSHKSKLS